MTPGINIWLFHYLYLFDYVKEKKNRIRDEDRLKCLKS